MYPLNNAKTAIRNAAVHGRIGKHGVLTGGTGYLRQAHLDCRVAIAPRDFDKYNSTENTI